MRNLPKTAKDIVDIIGMNAAMALVRNWPGIPLKVPAGRRPAGIMMRRLAAVIGKEAALKFIRHYGGEVVVIPRCAVAIRVARDQCIINQYNNGVTAANLAREHKLTVRHIRLILNRPGVDVTSDYCAGPVQLMLDF
jgi:hypothetical protein